MEYEVKRTFSECNAYRYIGYIDNEYAGYIYGHEKNANIFDIQDSELQEEFKGTKAVRAFSEIIKAIQKDYNMIVSRIDNKKNDALKIALSAGFHIIGTMSVGSEISVELLKTKGDV